MDVNNGGYNYNVNPGLMPNTMPGHQMPGHQIPGQQMPFNVQGTQPQIPYTDPTAGMNIYKPSSDGTMIADLVRDNDSAYSYSRGRGQGQNYHPQQDVYYTKPGNNYRDSYSDGNRSRDSDSSYSNIKELAEEVNSTLKALDKLESKKHKKTETETEEDELTNDNTDSDIILEEVEIEQDYLKLLTEFLMLLTLYVIMSQPFVLSYASTYITQLNPNEEGTINMTGIIIYGLILTVLFMVLRKVVFSRM